MYLWSWRGPNGGDLLNAASVVMYNSVSCSMYISQLPSASMQEPAMRLRRSPLVHVLAQVAFPPAPEWTERQSAVQKALYDMGFQRFREAELNHLTLDIGDGGQSPTLGQRAIAYREYADRDGRFAFQSTAEALLLHTTGYQDFGHFIRLLEQGLQAVGAAMGVQLVNRIGLRYVDLVQSRDGEQLSAFVKPGLLGFPFRDAPELGVTRAAVSSQSIGVTTLGALAIRSMTLPPGQFLPPDLDIAGLRAPENADPSQPGLVLDFDHYSIFAGANASAPPLDFDVKLVIAHVASLHADLKTAFLASVTDHAIQQWGGWEPVPQ